MHREEREREREKNQQEPRNIYIWICCIICTIPAHFYNNYSLNFHLGSNYFRKIGSNNNYYASKELLVMLFSPI